MKQLILNEEALRAKYDTNGNRYPEPTYGFILHTD
jgi:hypothetical protein